MASFLGKMQEFIFISIGRLTLVGVFPKVLLGNYRLLVLDPNFIYSQTHRTKMPVQFIKCFITKDKTSTEHTVQMRDLAEWQLI